MRKFGTVWAVASVLWLGVAHAAAPTIRNFSAISANRSSPSTQTIPQPLVGDEFVVFVFAFSAITTGLSDSAGNTCTSFGSVADANGNRVNIFTCPVTVAGGTTDTFTSTGGGTIQVNDLTGVAASAQIDGTIKSGTFSGSAGGTLTAAGLTTTFANDLILSAAIDQNNATSAFAASTGTMVTSAMPSGANGADADAIQQHSVTSTGTYAEAFTVAASSGQTAVIGVVAIKGTGSAPSGPPTNGFFFGSTARPAIKPWHPLAPPRRVPPAALRDWRAALVPRLAAAA